MSSPRRLSPPSPLLNKTVRNFNALARAYYEETFERFPVYGAGVGIRRLRGDLGHHRAEEYHAQLALARRTLGAVEDMPIHDFEADPWLDRLALCAQLRREIMNLGDLEIWRTNPQIHLEAVADGIYSLVIRHAENLRPVAEQLISRLKQVPRFLDEAAENIRGPVPLWVDLTREAVPGVCELIDTLPEPLAAASRHDRRELDRLCAKATEAVRYYGERVAKRKPGRADGFALGTERFETLMRERLGLNITAREAIAAGHGLADRLRIELKAEARKFHRTKTPHEILLEAAQQWTPEGKDLVDAYKLSMRAIKRRFQEAEALTFPRGETLQVKLVPEFMMHQIPTAAYSAPGPLDSDQTGIFWVNDLSKRQTTPEARQREVAQHFGVELTAAHEAYPGHHLQFIHQFHHRSMVRKLVDHAIYYEGWTLWCEQMSVDFEVSKNPYLKLVQLNDALWRANRILIDVGLHTGSMSYNQAVKLLMEEVGFTKARARVEINWYSSAPTIPMSYLLGKMELLRLKHQRVDRGGWTLKQFNDWVLGFGAIPWSWIEASGL